MSIRNTQTQWILGDSAGAAGYKFAETGLATKLYVVGTCTAYTAPSSTFTVTVYKNGITASDDVFIATYSIGAASQFGSTITPNASLDGTFDSGTEWFCKATFNGTVSTLIEYNIVLEGYFLG